MLTTCVCYRCVSRTVCSEGGKVRFLSDRKWNIGVLMVVVVLLVVSAYFIYPPNETTQLGLDLQGGLAVIMEAKDSPKAPRTEEGMQQTVSIIEERVDKLGVAEPVIRRQGEWKVSVELPGVDNPEEALQIIGRTAVLEFFDINQFGDSYDSKAGALEAAGVASTTDLPVEKQLILWPGKGQGAADRWFLADSAPLLTGSLLSGAQVGFDQLNRPKVDMQFQGQGGDEFANITQEMAQKAQVTGQDQLLVIVLDGTVQSAPRVNERIGGGRAEITGDFTLQESKQLALVLQTGALPIELEVLDEKSVGATLGQQSLTKALYAGAIGLALVLIFMVFYYRMLGLIADIALIVYGGLFWGILNGVHATLTLPGIAGMILTLGMAVDANVIIFARVREEIGEGKTVRTAINSGFKKGFRTILDANVTTLITAVVLFWAATGGVRGFAFTLGIGVALSMFTAIVVTRSLLGLMAEMRLLRSPRLLGFRVRTLERGTGGSE